MSGKTNDSLARGIVYTSAVTPSDSADLPNGVTRAIMVNESGDVAVQYRNGASDTLTLFSGTVYPIRAARILSTGTTATGIKACY